MLRAAERGVERERAGVGKAVEHAPPLGKACHGKAVILLVKEETRFLPVLEIDGIVYPVLAYLGHGALRMLLAGQFIPSLTLRKSFERADGNVVAFVYAVDPLPALSQHLDKQWEDHVLEPLHPNGERLRDEDVREPVHSQAGEAVCLAEDDAAAGHVPAHDGAAVVPRVPDAALPELRVKTVVRVAGDEPQAYLALAAVQPRAEIAPVFAERVDQRSVFRLGAFGDYLLRIYPRVTRADPCAAFLGDYKGGVFSFDLHFSSARIKYFAIL